MPSSSDIPETCRVDFASQVSELQIEFQDIIGRADWVGACVALQPGRVCQLGLGWSGTDAYAINRVWANQEYLPVKLVRPGVNGDDPSCWDRVKNEPVYAELLTLTQRAGEVCQKLLQTQKFSFNLRDADYEIHDSTQLWLVFLIHSLETCGYCRAMSETGDRAGCSEIKEGTTLVWIDQFAQVCLAGLAVLKAAIARTEAPQSMITPADHGNGRHGSGREPPARRGPKKPRNDPDVDQKVFQQWVYGYERGSFRSYDQCDKAHGHKNGTTAAAVARHRGRERQAKAN